MYYQQYLEDTFFLYVSTILYVDVYVGTKIFYQIL